MENTRERVATAYVIERDGTIFQAFDPMYWAYHLGGKTNTATQASTIGIEIVNWGPLTIKNGEHLNWIGDRIPTIQVVKTEKPFRGVVAFHKFSDPQYGAVKALIEDLCTTFSIPELYPRNPEDVLANVNSFFPGIYSHQNFPQGQSRHWPCMGLE
ncbi:MAG: N-acetylmuramoyl-L-alanine amidase [Candidatus Competibacteraceae bacterium]|nr:N-acetylmuramoyl-L-alanine amidase [Candidatus Competibacteraceae bacterium]